MSDDRRKRMLEDLRKLRREEERMKRLEGR